MPRLERVLFLLPYPLPYPLPPSPQPLYLFLQGRDCLSLGPILLIPTTRTLKPDTNTIINYFSLVVLLEPTSGMTRAKAPSTQANVFNIFGNQLHEAQEKITTVINGGIQTIQNEVDKNVQRSFEIVNKLKQDGEDIIEAIRKQADSIVDEMDKKINEITNGVDDNIIDECKLFSKGIKDVKELVLASIANVSYCVTDKIDQGSEYIENMNEAAIEGVNSLIQINNEALECTKKVTNIESTVKAVSCLGLASARATWAVTKEVPKVAINFGKLGAMVGTLPQSLSFCSAATTLSLIIDEANNYISSVDKCIHLKLSANSTDVPGDGIFA
ncbi:hypothetical protein M0802_004149 [Mischocyttarus mexicanus]|nr:hypothetical protein M0802_004149 [Mischocyttarus mexicanus]